MMYGVLEWNRFAVPCILHDHTFLTWLLSLFIQICPASKAIQYSEYCLP